MSLYRILFIAVLLAVGACSKPAPPAPAPADPPAVADAAPVDVPAGAYTLDRSHASLLFRVDHLGFSNYTARFRNFDAKLQFDPANLAASTVSATIDPRSIETDFPDPAKLDFNAVLQGEQWLDSAQSPQMTYRSTAIEVTGPRTMKINGELTLRGITKPVALDATFNGGYAGHPMDPNARIGFSARGTLLRSDFGMSYGIPEAGTKMGVSDQVEIIIETEFNGPALEPKAGAESQAQ
jgi:polyisoprenoid-binding protein YceI